VLEVAYVLNAWHGLRLVQRFGANVSVELHTDLAHDITRTVAYAKRFYAICPEKFYIKVPLTPAGFLAARQLAKSGIPINFTLGFSARQNYLAARLTQSAFVNVFMGRLNAFVADSGLGTGENVGEKATLSTQRELIELRKRGQSPSRLIGASMREGAQVSTLVGLDVFTMPTKVAAAYHAKPSGEVASRVKDDPSVPLATGVQLEDFNGTTLWEVPEAFKKCVDKVLARDVDRLDGPGLQAHFAEAGFPDFLPEWSEADVAAITSDGKIPSYERWCKALGGGTIGLDALMNVSGLYSFVQDQQALDQRIVSLL